MTYSSMLSLSLPTCSSLELGARNLDYVDDEVGSAVFQRLVGLPDSLDLRCVPLHQCAGPCKWGL